MFERFTADARQVVIDAQHEVRRRRDPVIGTEHLLLALMRGDTPLAALLHGFGLDAARLDTTIDGLLDARRAQPHTDEDALAALGIDLGRVRHAVEEAFGEGALARAAAATTVGRPRRPWPSWRRRRRPQTAPSPITPTRHIPFGNRAKKVLELSLREALRLKHNFIAAEHIALALAREGRGLGCAALSAGGVDLERLRHALEQQLARRAA